MKQHWKNEARKRVMAMVRQLREEGRVIEEANKPRDARLPRVDRDAWAERFGKDSAQ